LKQEQKENTLLPSREKVAAKPSDEGAMPDSTTHDPSERRPATINQARALRRRATLTERTLWTLLRNRRLAGLKFRRQVPLGPYVADFVCLAHRLIVEADGPFHDPAHDARRDQWLRTQGFHVLRFGNKAIQDDGFSVIDQIQATATLLPLREKVSAKLTDEGPPRPQHDPASPTDHAA
jgi:very-short-patch-repair endonuclease